MLQNYLPPEPAHYDALHLDRRIKARVLIVADTAAQRYAVGRALRNEGFEVFEATTGAEALALAARTPLDAVVLDVHLPDIDGYEVCRRLKAASAVMLPVLHLSSTSTSDAARARGLDAGADGYLTHPFDPNVLRAAVSALVRLKRQETARVAQVAATSLLQEALDALSDHIALLGPTGEVIAVNTAWATFSADNGYPDAGTSGLGANYCDVCARATGADSEGAAEAGEGLRQVLAGERDQYALDYSCHSAEERRWFRMTARRVKRPGPVAAIVTHTDTTAEHQRLQSDARFRRFVETAHEGVLAMDRVGRITYANPRIASLLGYGPAELEGHHIFEFVTSEAEFAARTRFAGQWSGGENGVELHLRRRDGRVIELLSAESPLRDERGEVVGVLAMLSDMTDRNATSRRTTEALRTADLDRRRLEATLEAIPVGVWLADADGRLTHSNPAADRVWGGFAPRVGSAREYGKYRAIWPATGAVVSADEWALARTLVSGEPITGEMVEIERFDGSRGFVLNSAAPILDADGRITGGVVINVDVTRQQSEAQERERLVASLERERTHLSTVFEQAPSFFATLRGPTHVFERVNLAYQQLIGHRAVIGQRLADALPETADQGFISLLDGVRATGEPFVGRQLPVQLARTPGAPLETRYLDFVYQRLEAPDGDHAIVAHGIDVTDQVLANEKLVGSKARLREQFAKLPVPTFLWELRGDDFVLLEANEAGSKTIPDFSSDMLGQSHRHLFPDRADTNRDMRDSLRSNTVIRRSLELSLGPTMGARHLDFTIGPQQPDRVLVHINDTTERIGLEAQLRQAQKMEAVGQLAGGVAHDFNNLLTVIGAHSAFLLETLDASDPQREDAEAIQQASVRAAGLTRQLLAFSRKQILKPQVIDLNATVADTHQMLRRLLGEDIDIVTSFAAGLPRAVADPGQMEQVLVNLAVNARDAMPDGGRLTITTRVTSVPDADSGARLIVPPGAYVTLAVRDTGAGMSEEVQARLFEPFFTTKAPGKGTGLGLATVYGIVKQSSGYITVSSTIGEGTTFEVMLPAVSADEAHEQLQEAERAVARGIETVLLVEDEPAIRAAAKRMLQRLGYVVLEAVNGDAAISLSAAFDAPIHLVVSDAVMPGMGGAETVRLLQAHRPSLKALMISGYTDDEIVRRGIVTSSVRFVQKPFTAAVFGRAVREALEDRAPDRASERAS
jgi:two-component system cell cycle sensor histidine kinase/response regulator CckA